ncbi:2-oxo acid dehydrogenase subunit E2 [Marinilabiliaceae bacterium JC017]|nr:2-oxo acid dehydrogenase subunit E2 [Marinilabiliaceae bacterium JC017]
MSTFEIIMPKMGESVEEATITKWFVSEGDLVQEDDVLLEIATDKVDSEIPSPVAGTIKEIKFKVDDVVPVGTSVAIIALERASNAADSSEPSEPIIQQEEQAVVAEKEILTEQLNASQIDHINRSSARFYSPLVRSMAKSEGISAGELEQVVGTGKNGRVTKADIQSYLNIRIKKVPTKEPLESSVTAESQPAPQPVKEPQKVHVSVGDEIVEMDRMRKLIAEHMVMSKQVSPHVTSVVEADVTNIVWWRNKVKETFQNKYGEKLTFMPVFTEAIAKALRDYPGINASVDGDRIILRRQVNIGIAVALPSGNLIVPVVRQADQKNLVGLAGDINRLAGLARNNKLSPDDIQGGTFTITNFGSFKNIIGTPIINQPQVAILATGSIEKKPAVVETPTGDVIAIRHKMFLSLSYDHRVVDGALGGSFLRRIADYLEDFDINREI